MGAHRQLLTCLFKVTCVHECAYSLASWFPLYAGLTATDLDWTITEVADPVYGEETAVELDVNVDFTPDSANKKGEGLWRVGMFGSESPDGDGDRYGDVYQTLNEEKATTAKKGTELVIDDIATEFEIGTIGCTEVRYICVEFAQGDDPDPPFTMNVESSRGDTSTTSLVTCKEHECSARKSRCPLHTLVFL